MTFFSMFLTINRKKHKTKVVCYYLGYNNVKDDFCVRSFLGYLLGLKVERKKIKFHFLEWVVKRLSCTTTGKSWSLDVLDGLNRHS